MREGGMERGVGREGARVFSHQRGDQGRAVHEPWIPVIPLQ